MHGWTDGRTLQSWRKRLIMSCRVPPQQQSCGRSTARTTNTSSPSCSCDSTAARPLRAAPFRRPSPAAASTAPRCLAFSKDQRTHAPPRPTQPCAPPARMDTPKHTVANTTSRPTRSFSAVGVVVSTLSGRRWQGRAEQTGATACRGHVAGMTSPFHLVVDACRQDCHLRPRCLRGGRVRPVTVHSQRQTRIAAAPG